MLRSLLLLSSLVLLATAATAAGPPLDTPPMPDVPLGPIFVEPPPIAPPVGAPPLDLVLPAPPGRPELAALLEVHPAPPVPRRGSGGPPDLVGIVELPPGAEHVFDRAPPFGGDGRRVRDTDPVPEPGTGALLALGLASLALRRRR